MQCFFYQEFFFSRAFLFFSFEILNIHEFIDMNETASCPQVAGILDWRARCLKFKQQLVDSGRANSYFGRGKGVFFEKKHSGEYDLYTVWNMYCNMRDFWNFYMSWLRFALLYRSFLSACLVVLSSDFAWWSCWDRIITIQYVSLCFEPQQFNSGFNNYHIYILYYILYIYHILYMLYIFYIYYIYYIYYILYMLYIYIIYIYYIYTLQETNMSHLWKGTSSSQLLSQGICSFQGGKITWLVQGCCPWILKQNQSNQSNPKHFRPALTDLSNKNCLEPSCHILYSYRWRRKSG